VDHLGLPSDRARNGHAVGCISRCPRGNLISLICWPRGVSSVCRGRLPGGVVQRGTVSYPEGMTLPEEPAADVSVRQFVSDSGAVTRGLRQGRAYTLTLNGEPLARMIPIRRRRAIPKGEVFAIFATAPAVDADELRADLDEDVSQELRDPYEGTGL
jgi:antitoxin (DNA-binding transcriptional repressor) of toxin-antitoxin stability system